MAVFKMLTTIAVVLMFGYSAAVEMKAGPLENMDMSHRLFLDRDNKFLMLWTPEEDEITFEIQVETTGYAGLGFSPSGGMTNADIIIGWVADDMVYLHDRYATGKSMPTVDEMQNVDLLGGYQNETHTVLRFKRAWDTCDDEDMIISGDTMRFIWAYSDNDPTDENSVPYHSKRGTRSLYTKEPQFMMPEFGDDVKSWDLISPNIPLPNKIDTLYWCKLFKVPELPRKVHAIGYVPILQEENLEHVHHVVLYECILEDSSKHFEKWLDVQGAQCHSENMPVSWTKCTTPLIAWAIGSDGELFPEHVGFPIGEEHGGASYFLMEMHYDNPKLKQDIFDNSGLRIFYTENLREFEAGYLMIGSDVSHKNIIPPNLEEWTTVGLCEGTCTQNTLPTDGIQVFQGLLHSHVLGRSLKLRQIRDGIELPTKFEDMSYDFNYQQTRVLNEEMTVLPGDSFITECGLNSKIRNVPTFGGLGTSEEMCLAFLAYYPRANISLCSSAPQLKNIYQTLGVEEIYESDGPIEFDLGAGGKEIDERKEDEVAEAFRTSDSLPEAKEIKMSAIHHLIVAKSPEKYFNVSLYDILHDEETWKDPELLSRFQDMSSYSTHTTTCLSVEFRKIEGVPAKMDYPEFVELEPEASSCGLEGEFSSDESNDLPRQTGGPQSEEETQVLGTIPEGDLTHRVNLDQGGNFIMLWTPDKDLITFEVQVATKGYVGLGFSSNGGMKGSDIILGWVDDNTGESFLQDRYATGKKMPEVDTDDNVELLGAYQNDTHTVLRFRRPWDTCDEEHDMIITEDTLRIIWAFGDEDPADNDVNSIPYHFSQRGTISLYLKEPQFVLPEFGADVKAWELRSPNVALPNDLDTLYWCKIFKIPPLENKNYIIGYEPVVAEDNLEHVHHIVIYECHLTDSDRHFEKFLEADGSQCFGPNMPPSWYHCSSPVVAWAIGGKGSIYPDNVGFPLGEEHGGATYFMMEMHYDNPNLKEGVVDNSGLKIYHTEEEKIEASILLVGHDVAPTMIIPPGQEWVTVGHCSGECTESALPPDGINVFAGLLHAHLLGVNLTLRHIRGNNELPILLKDSSYDFNFQEGRATDVTILPGDKLITECGYDSTNKKRTTFGGFGTDEEMCLAFLYYYPRVDVHLCASKPKMENIFESIGIEEIYNPDAAGGFDPTANGIDEEAETELANGMKNGDLSSQVQKVNLALAFKGIVVKSPTKYENQSLYDILSNEDTWKGGDVARRLQDAVYSGDHEVQCTNRYHARRNAATNPGAIEPAIPESFYSEIRDMQLVTKILSRNGNRTRVMIVRQKERVTISYPEFKPFPPPESSCGLNNPGAGNPLACPPEMPSCSQFNFPSNVLGNKPFHF